MSNPFAPALEPLSNLGRYRFLAPSCGLRVSPLCLGTMSIGEKWGMMLGPLTKEAGFEFLDAFYDKGGNFIDTANAYQGGDSELWLGEWMAKRQNRDEMVLATKYTLNWNDAGNIKANYYGNHYKSMVLSVDASLKKLQTSYIDILYLHSWDFTTSIEEIMQGLNNLVKSGKVLYLGISDTPAWIVSEANRYAKDHGLAPFVIYQGKYNVSVRDLEREIIPMARAHGMAIASFGSLGSGKFQTKADVEKRKAEGKGLRRSLAGNFVQTEEEVKISAGLEKVAGEVGSKSVTAVALAYAMHKYPYMFPVIGGNKIAQLEANLEAISISLSDAQMSYLESVTAFDYGFPCNFIGTDPHSNGGKMINVMAATAQYQFVQTPKSVVAPAIGSDASKAM
ncbi:Aldo/keto reductase [Pseudohyphozyma bogoriensis]|nr:Aldo/keto reductase [Pseudohyphozyma bogoriensis]